MNGLDNIGQNIGETYRILSDPSFEKRLKVIDSRLKLLFDQNRKRWMILEKAYDSDTWNIILVAEDENKNEKPLGEWVFNKLWVMKKRYEEKREMGANKWFSEMISKVNKEKEIEKQKASVEHKAMIVDDLLQWRKAAKALQGLPVSDVTAGYRKI